MVKNTKAEGRKMKKAMTARTGVLLKLQNICHRKTRTSVEIRIIQQNHGATWIQRVIGVTVIFLNVVSCMMYTMVLACQFGYSIYCNTCTCGDFTSVNYGACLSVGAINYTVIFLSGALLLGQQWQCISSFVFYIDSKNYSAGMSEGAIGYTFITKCGELYNVNHVAGKSVGQFDTLWYS